MAASSTEQGGADYHFPPLSKPLVDFSISSVGKTFDTGGPKGPYDDRNKSRSSSGIGAMMNAGARHSYNGQTPGAQQQGDQRSHGTYDPHDQQMPLFTRTDRTNFEEEEDKLSPEDYNRMRELLDDTTRQLGQVEHINEDLEHRLERQARQHLQTVRSKDNKLIKSNKERDGALSQIEHWKHEYDAQVRRTEATAERLRRVEKELYRMHLQKYNVMNGEHFFFFIFCFLLRVQVLARPYKTNAMLATVASYCS